jgi:LytS/YehU family sensor histidine kinase
MVVGANLVSLVNTACASTSTVVHTPLGWILFVQEEISASSAALLDPLNDQIQKTLLYSLIPVVVAFSFIVFIFYRAKREAFFKQKETELKLRISEVEMKALRAQINPHFIFNCLNSIHHYMHQQDVKQAGEYLIKFSQLIRYVLETSSSRMVSLADDLEALKPYMELEQLRMQQSFEFEINTHAIPDLDSIHIPPMMIQPFVENSIWHGLSHRGSGGMIRICINKKDNMVQCILEDNGKRNISKNNGDRSATVKKTSMGMSLIKDRLAVVSEIYNVKADFKMEDCLLDPTPREGTRIMLVLPYEE